MKTTRYQCKNGQRSRQRGAVAVFVGISIIALIAIMLLVLDVGRLYYAQRQLETEANLAALAGAQILSGCSGADKGTPGTLADVTSAVLQSLKDNRGTIGSFTDLGDPASLLTGINNADAVVLGRTFTLTDGIRTFQSVADQQAAGMAPVIENSVQVNLSARQPKSYLLPDASTKFLYASATAKQAAVGSFFLGTGVLDLSGGAVNQLLGALLCAGDAACQQQVAALNLASASGGLAAVNVSLGQLATALGVSVKDLSDPVALSTHTPVLSEVLNGLSSSLSGTASATVTGLLTNLASAVSGNRNTIPLGQLLGTVDDVAGDVPFVNLTSLISALGAAAQPGVDGQVQPIALQPTVTIPSIATVGTFLNIGKPPQLGGPGPAGQTTASTAEATVMVRISAGALLTGLKTSIVDIINGLLGVLQALGVNSSVNVVPGPLNLGVDIAVAPATASLDKLQCPAIGSGPVANLSANPAIATVSVGTFSGTAADAPPLDSAQTDFPLANVSIDASKACIGVYVLGACVGVSANLGKTDIALGLQLTSLGVGGSGNQALAPIDQFSLVNQPNKNPPDYFLADGAPASTIPSTENPQTVGSPVDATLTLGLTNTETGSGLIGALGGLVNGLLSGVESLVQPLVSVVNDLATSLINPLLQLLGIQLGTATVTMNTATFGQPTIQTNCIPNAALPMGCPVVPAS